MKFGSKPREIWKKPAELNGKFNRLNNQLNRLMVLDHVWNKLIGTKQRFWKLKAVKGNVLYVAVQLAVAKNELTVKKETLINELNKYFDKPWIKKIEIVSDLGDTHE
ncbi:MAG: DUF721 domain-containing protein [Elusimicrobiaceae bacterium]|nr:DUF721 domain-containing protein [Elusimicrobiaceae bacterium]